MLTARPAISFECSHSCLSVRSSPLRAVKVTWPCLTNCQRSASVMASRRELEICHKWVKAAGRCFPALSGPVGRFRIILLLPVRSNGIGMSRARTLARHATTRTATQRPSTTERGERRRSAGRVREWRLGYGLFSIYSLRRSGVSHSFTMSRFPSPATSNRT